MTPTQAEKALLEAGYYARWEGRYLHGYSKGRHPVLDDLQDTLENLSFRFEVALLEANLAEVTVTGPKATPEQDQAIWTGHPFGEDLFEVDEGGKVLRGLRFQSSLSGAVEGLIQALRFLHRGGKDNFFEREVGSESGLSAGFLLGQAAPSAESEVEALQLLFSPTPSEDALFREAYEIAPPSIQRSASEAEHIVRTFDLGDRPEKRRSSERKQLELQEGVVRPFPEKPPGQGPVSIRRYKVPMPLLHWYPLERMQSWPGTLRRRDRSAQTILSTCRVPVEAVEGMIHFEDNARQKLNLGPLLVFSDLEPQDGQVTVALGFGGADPFPEGAQPPRWLANLFRQPGDDSRLEQTTWYLNLPLTE